VAAEDEYSDDEGQRGQRSLAIDDRRTATEDSDGEGRRCTRRKTRG
jgi:hypothetical protein